MLLNKRRVFDYIVVADHRDLERTEEGDAGSTQRAARIQIQN
jgi:hypothetical protein